MGAITVHGRTLAGMAVAARLAKVGHQVTLVDDGPSIGPLPDVFTLPAAWRDLFKKSGRTLAAELARHNLDLTPVETRHVTVPGHASLDLPAERGAQFHVLTERFGEDIAIRWRDLLDQLDDVWQARRPLGLESESEYPAFRSTRKQLWTRPTVATLARRFRHPVLSEVIRLSAEGDPRRSPATEAMWLSVERTFGLWQVTDTSGVPAGTSRLVELLDQRLQTRGVEVVEGPRTGTPPDPRAGAPADAVIWAHLGTRRAAAFRKKPWWRRTGSRLGEGHYTCGDHTAAGSTMAGQLLSAALAAYSVHLDLTGENIHPTNKDLSPSGRPRHRPGRGTPPTGTAPTSA